MSFWITNATLILRDEVAVDAALYIEGDKIKDIISKNALPKKASPVYNAAGCYVMPGMIDLHSDAIEREIEPRPATQLPFELVLPQLERRLIAQGITCTYHSLSFANGEGIRSNETAMEILEAIRNYPRPLIKNKIHVRYEITNIEAFRLIQEILRLGLTDFFSIMDHSPGQGQYKTIESFYGYVEKTYHLPKEDIDAIVQERIARRENISPHVISELINLAISQQIPVASHDDDSPQRVLWAKNNGIKISEFPMNLETAVQAARAGIFTVIGAPNVVRECSHNGNLSAMEAIKNNAVRVICSDYYSGGMLYAVFKAAKQIGHLPKAVRMVTYNPAQALKINDEVGCLEVGKAADLIIVDNSTGEFPMVTKAFVNGRLVFQCDDTSFASAV